MGWVFTRLPGGDVNVDLGRDERAVLESLPDQLGEVLRSSPGEPALTRLAPPAYVEEPEHEEEYRRFMGEDLRERQLAALSVMSETASASRLTEEQAQGWLSALNSLRLVLGTQLDVDDDIDDDIDDDSSGEADEEGGPEDVRGPALQLYRYLSMLLNELVSALTEGLPEVVDESL